MGASLSELFPSIPADDLEQLLVYTSGHLNDRWGMGRSPALLIVDMTRCFVEDRASAAFVPAAEGCATAIAAVLQCVRALNLPVFFTRGTLFRSEIEAGAWLRGRPFSVLATVNHPEDHQIVAGLQPLATETVITKAKPSAFFGTSLAAMLNYVSADTLIVTGVTTSGCIRATVNDAFSLNYRVIVPVECVADRARLSHEVELFDMAVKYADVVRTEELIERLDSRSTHAR